MEPVRQQLKRLFEELDQRIRDLARERKRAGLPGIRRAKIQLLGQVSLLVDERVCSILSLAQTGDLDAFLSADSVFRDELKKALRERGLIYDEDSPLIWIPPGSKFAVLFDLDHVLVESIDPESALVSKAVKAPGKNKQLIREAIASGEFPELVDRMLANGGKLEHFA